MIYDVIYLLLVLLIFKLVFFSKQLQGFIISLRLIAESSILDFLVVLAASLDINFLYRYFMIVVNSLFLEFINLT